MKKLFNVKVNRNSPNMKYNERELSNDKDKSIAFAKYFGKFIRIDSNQICLTEFKYLIDNRMDTIESCGKPST